MSKQSLLRSRMVESQTIITLVLAVHVIASRLNGPGIAALPWRSVSTPFAYIPPRLSKTACVDVATLSHDPYSLDARPNDRWLWSILSRKLDAILNRGYSTVTIATPCRLLPSND